MPWVADQRLRRWLVLSFAALALFLGAADGPQAARAAADVVLVSAEEVIDEDFYAAGTVVLIEGVVEGDLVVFAFDRLVVSGTIEGDVIGYASSVRITGTVGGSVRLVGVDIVAAGDIGGDLFVGAWDVTTEGTVGHDVLAWSRTLTVGGEVGRDMQGQTWGQATISGSVGRDIEMTVGELRVVEGAVVGENLTIRTSKVAEISEGASIRGVVSERSPVRPNVSVVAAKIVGLVLAFLGFLSAGILVIWVLPSTVENAVSSVQSSPLRSAAIGAAALVSPIVILIAGVASAIVAPSALGVVILTVGTPIWLGLTAALVLVTLLAPVPVLIALGWRLTKHRWSAFATFVLFALTIPIVLFIPYVRALAMLAVALVGVGALVQGARAARGSAVWAIRRADLELSSLGEEV